MTQLSIQMGLVDDRRRNLAAQRHESAWPIRLEPQMPTKTETRSILGQPSERPQTHDHVVPDMAARHPLHEPLGHPRLGAPL